MKLNVELQAYLAQYSPDGQDKFEYELPDGARVKDLVARLHVPDEMASIVVISGKSVGFDDELHDGDQVTLIPPLAGG